MNENTCKITVRRNKKFFEIQKSHPWLAIDAKTTASSGSALVVYLAGEQEEAKEGGYRLEIEYIPDSIGDAMEDFSWDPTPPKATAEPLSAEELNRMLDRIREDNPELYYGDGSIPKAKARDALRKNILSKPLEDQRYMYRGWVHGEWLIHPESSDVRGGVSDAELEQAVEAAFSEPTTVPAEEQLPEIPQRVFPGGGLLLGHAALPEPTIGQDVVDEINAARARELAAKVTEAGGVATAVGETVVVDTAATQENLLAQAAATVTAGLVRVGDVPAGTLCEADGKRFETGKATRSGNVQVTYRNEDGSTVFSKHGIRPETLVTVVPVAPPVQPAKGKTPAPRSASPAPQSGKPATPGAPRGAAAPGGHAGVLTQFINECLAGGHNATTSGTRTVIPLADLAGLPSMCSRPGNWRHVSFWPKRVVDSMGLQAWLRKDGLHLEPMAASTETETE